MADRPSPPPRAPERPAPAAQGRSPPPREPVRSATDSLTVGVLVKHGRAPLEFDPRAAESYFVTVQTERGERTLWSRGLERAITESRTQPRPGDPVGVRENGIDPVSFIMRERNRKGDVVMERRLDTPRGHWIVERREFFDERATAAQLLRDPRTPRRQALRDHPELAGAYWALDSAQKVAAARIQIPENRERFLMLVRETLALAMERGEATPTKPSNVRDRAAGIDRRSELTADHQGRTR